MSKKATLSLELAKKMYGGTDKELRAFALENYPELGDITARIKTFEDACEDLGIPTTLPNVSNLPCDLKDKITIGYKLSVIAKALNQGWQVDWSNDEQKWFPYFVQNKNESELRFSISFYYCSGSSVPSHLCFKSKELSDYAGKQFINLYKEYHV